MPDTPQNPYLALLQQQDTGPTWAQVLQNIGNLGFGLAGGFGQAAATGQPTMAGVGPGLMLGNQMNVQAANAAEQDRLKRAEIGLKAQEYEDKRSDLKRKQDALAAYLKDPGFNAVAPTSPLLGPNTTAQPSSAQPAGADLKTGGAPIVDYLTTKYGFSPLAAATVAGNLYQESGFNPANNTGDSGSAFGMAQWRLDRQTALRNFAAAQNKPATDPQVQLDYLVSEMKGGDMGAQRAYAGLQQATTPEQANTAMMHFFRPAGYTPANPAGGHGFQNRVQNTQALLQNGQPAPQVAQGDAVAPQPRPGPTLSALPAFEGPGAGTIQPGALPPGVVPSVNLPSPAPQGATVMPGGTRVDPNAPAPPFMQTGAGGPGVVQPQYTPQPGQPTMGGAPAPAAANPPPTFVPPAQVPLPPEFNAHVNRLVATELITPAAGEKMKQDYSTELNKQVHESARAQYQAQVDIWKQREQIAVEQRKIQAQIEAEQRAVAQKDKEHARNRKEEGQFVTQADGSQVYMTKEQLGPGTVQYEKPPAPPSPGTPAGDDHILSTADPGSVAYRDAYERKAGTPHVVNGQTYVPDMRGVPAPTYGQAGTAGPAVAPAGQRSDVPGKVPVGDKNYTESQSKEHSFVTQLNGAIPQLEDLVRGKDGNYTSENLPGNFGRVVGAFPFAPEVIVPDKVKELRRIEREIVSATLRQVSGATIKAEEYRDEASKYIPQSGDPPEVIANKLAALKRFSVSMAEGTGRPLDKYPNVKSYAATNGAPAPAQPAGANTGNVPVYDLSGKRIK